MHGTMSIKFAPFVAASLIFSEVICYGFATEISIFFFTSALFNDAVID